MPVFSRSILCLLLAPLTSPAAAQLIFDDGGAHVLTGNQDTQDVQVLNGSQLTVDGSFIGSTFLADNATITVNGSLSSELGDDLLVAQGNSSVVVNHGAMLVGEHGTGVNLQDGSQLLILGGSIQGNDRDGVILSGTSVTTMSNGEIRSRAFDNIESGPAVLLNNSAVFTMSGGLLRSQDLGVVSQGDSRFEASGGAIDVDTIVPNAGIQAFDQSHVLLNAVSMRIDSSQITPPMLDANDTAVITVDGGAFDYKGFEATINESASLQTDNSATMSIHGGTFDIYVYRDAGHLASDFKAPFNVFAANESSHVGSPGTELEFAL